MLAREGTPRPLLRRAQEKRSDDIVGSPMVPIQRAVFDFSSTALQPATNYLADCHVSGTVLRVSAGFDLGDDLVAPNLGVLVLIEKQLAPSTRPRFAVIQNPAGLLHDSSGGELPLSDALRDVD